MAVSPQAQSLRNPAAFGMPKVDIPQAPSVPTPPPVPGLGEWTRTDVPRPSAAQQQSIIDRLGALPGVYKGEREDLSGGLQRQLQGVGGYTLIQRDDGTMTWTYDPGAARRGQLQRQAVKGNQAQANAQGMLFSSFTDQAIGNALSQISAYAVDALRQYSSQIRLSYERQEAERFSLTGQLQDLIANDARWAIENPPPTPPEQFTHPPISDPARFTPGERLWAGPSKPSEADLRAMYPGLDIELRQNPATGSWEAFGTPSYRTLNPPITGRWAQKPNINDPNVVVTRGGDGYWYATRVDPNTPEVGGWATKPDSSKFPNMVFYKRGDKWFARRRLY